jgi:putative ABC transport system ATP-binding protein
MITLEGVTKTYRMGRIDVHALQGIDLQVERGEFVAIMGASGSGKSTLMNIIGCLDVPTAGRYILDGTDVERLNDDELAKIRNRKIGFVFQSFNLIPRTTALHNVEMPLIYAGERGRTERAREALGAVGLADRVDHQPTEMSGGQQQRAAIARGLALKGQVLVADEVTSELDATNRQRVIDLLRAEAERGAAVVLATHDPDAAAACDAELHLVDGRAELVRGYPAGLAA